MSLINASIFLWFFSEVIKKKPQGWNNTLAPVVIGLNNIWNKKGSYWATSPLQFRHPSFLQNFIYFFKFSQKISILFKTVIFREILLFFRKIITLLFSRNFRIFCEIFTSLLAIINWHQHFCLRNKVSSI